MDKRLEEEEELERQKELAEEEARRKKEQEELAKSEERIRKMQEEEEKRRKEERRKRLMRIKEEERYRAYFYKKAEEAKLDSQLPPRVGFAWSFLIGFEPNLGNSANEGFTFGNQIPFPTASQYLNQTPNKGGAAIANAFQSSVNELNSLLPEGSKEAKVTDSSASLSAFPIAAAAYYYSETYMVRLGVHFSWSVIGLGGTNRFVFYNDSGQELYLEHKMKMIRFHIPLSFALRLLASKKYGAFVGGGPSFFYGVNISTFDSNQTTTYPDPTAGTITTTRKGGTENFITEEDIFQATALGFHILVGIEAEVYKGFMVSVELYQTFGSSGLVEDRKLNARTESTLGTAETDRADAISLNFSGTQILFGVKRFL
ncbi:MAG: hypothetical protein D6767_05465 [Candidatus Hydrogenedentota bacterium]|nr:MAG: hypothetical protein D6767_05465 [Candidatus Hydrogenedentota bacterium]